MKITLVFKDRDICWFQNGMKNNEHFREVINILKPDEVYQEMEENDF